MYLGEVEIEQQLLTIELTCCLMGGGEGGVDAQVIDITLSGPILNILSSRWASFLFTQFLVEEMGRRANGSELTH